MGWFLKPLLSFEKPHNVQGFQIRGGFTLWGSISGVVLQNYPLWSDFTLWGGFMYQVISQTTPKEVSGNHLQNDILHNGISSSEICVYMLTTLAPVVDFFLQTHKISSHVMHWNSICSLYKKKQHLQQPSKTKSQQALILRYWSYAKVKDLIDEHT